VVVLPTPPFWLVMARMRATARWGRGESEERPGAGSIGRPWREYRGQSRFAPFRRARSGRSAWFHVKRRGAVRIRVPITQHPEGRTAFLRHGPSGRSQLFHVKQFPTELPGVQ